MRVHPYSLSTDSQESDPNNSPEAWQAAIDQGVDCLQTNYPAKLLCYLMRKDITGSATHLTVLAHPRRAGLFRLLVCPTIAVRRFF
ncbi:MAG: hypothetical protein ACRD11_13960 [Terriglobia bacterium]